MERRGAELAMGRAEYWISESVGDRVGMREKGKQEEEEESKKGGEEEEEEEDDGVHVSSVWKDLPHHLHGRVLEKLPFSALVRFLSVCKAWKSTIFSGGFEHSQGAARKCVPLYFHEDGPFAFFNRRTNSWQRISCSFLKTPTANLLSLLVSAGGLLCFKSGLAGELVVCNPVSKQSRRLQVPCSIFHHDSISVVPSHAEVVEVTTGYTRRLEVCHLSAIDARRLEVGRLSTIDKEGVVGMLMDREGRNYKLLVAGVTLPGGSTERGTLAYDSSTKCWKKGGDVPRGFRFWRTDKPVASNGFFYFLSYCKDGWMDDFGETHDVWTDDVWTGSFVFERLRCILRYDVETGKWHVVRLPRYQEGCVSHSRILFQLVENQGRTLIVQRRATDETQICISEITDEGTVVPFVTSSFPLNLFPDKKDLMIGDWCVGQGDQFYFVGIYPENSWQNCLHSGNYLLTQIGICLGFGMLAYNPSDNTWNRLPDLCGKYYPEGVHAFEPSLAHV